MGGDCCRLFLSAFVGLICSGVVRRSLAICLSFAVLLSIGDFSMLVLDDLG